MRNEKRTDKKRLWKLYESSESKHSGTERRLQTLEKSKFISQLSFEDWVKFQNGELKIK